MFSAEMELYEDALSYFDRVLSVAPSDFYCLYSKGVLLYLLANRAQGSGQGNTEVLHQAQHLLSQSINQDPNNELAFLYRAKVSQLLENNEQARQDILRALTLKPSLSKQTEAQSLIRKYLME